jgi:hypothetical protein
LISKQSRIPTPGTAFKKKPETRKPGDTPKRQYSNVSQDSVESNSEKKKGAKPSEKKKKELKQEKM